MVANPANPLVWDSAPTNLKGSLASADPKGEGSASPNPLSAGPASPDPLGAGPSAFNP
jgi:hypothetical protein